MFKKDLKDKELLKKDEADSKIHQDFVTRNMPEFNRFSGQTFSSEASLSEKKTKINIPAKKDHRKVGVLIISGGIIFVLILLYFGYSYFIKPNLIAPGEELIIPSPLASSSQVTEEQEVEVLEPEEVIVLDEPIIATNTPEILDAGDLVMPEELPIISAVVTLSKVDSDADGLTDDEEEILGTDPNRADTDDDGYLDLAEIKSGYDPLVPAEKLSQNSKVLHYQIDSMATVIYPTSWELVESESNNMVMFADEDRAFIQVLYQENPQKLTPSAWFSDQFDGLRPGETISGDSWEGFFSQDGLSAYIFSQDFSKVYNFSCSPLTADTSSVILFNLMLKTLTIK